MTQDEQKEFLELKYILCERGFFVPSEEIRWNYLFNKQAKSFKQKMDTCLLIFKQEELN
jgi:hypothetical protein